MKKNVLIVVTALISLGWNLRGYPFNGKTHKALAEIFGRRAEVQDANYSGEKITGGEMLTLGERRYIKRRFWRLGEGGYGTGGRYRAVKPQAKESR